MNVPKPIVLLILDGWGIAPPSEGNAVSRANVPNIKRLYNVYPHTQLIASGEAVGLPRGEPGNSETGHLNLGAGKVVFQALPQINMAIADGTFFSSYALKAAKQHVNNNHSSLHLMGLIGSGGVHSNIEHLFALLRWTKEQNLTKVYLHLFTDGRDSSPTISLEYLKLIEERIKFYGVGKIATIMGRFYSMDRDNRWERTQRAYEALTDGKGIITNSYTPIISKLHQEGKSDEFIEPIIIQENNQPPNLINDNDAVIFFNFRIDRPRQLTKAFVLPDFENIIIKKSFDPYAEKYGKKQYEEEGKMITTFSRNKILHNLLFVTMTEYEADLPVLTILPPDQVDLPLCRILAEKSWRQLHIAETEKERHITYYFNGKRENSFSAEDWVIIPSPRVNTYDLKPEMSTYSITDEVIKRLKLNIYDFIVINFANPDMVGHTGVIKAGIRACEVADECLGKIVDVVTAQQGVCIITADHGNIEEMINLTTGEIDTQHSINPVPFIITGLQFQNKPILLPKGVLADITPTILKIADIPKTSFTTGKSLV